MTELFGIYFWLLLQAILLALDCSPRSLTKHIPSMASSRNVPVIFVKDNKRGSMRLGELVKLKTAMAIGVKVGFQTKFLFSASSFWNSLCF